MSQTSRTPRGRASPSIEKPELIWVRGDRLHPNPWNPNRMNAFMYAKAMESISEFGFVDPLTVRKHGDQYEIIDGEHRWRAGLDLQMEFFPAFVIVANDVQAKKLTLVLNELRGQARPDLLAELLKDLESDLGADELMQSLPYTPEILQSLIDLPALPALDAAGPSSPATPGPAEPKERWVERTYRMPKTVADVIDDAIEKIRLAELADTGQPMEEWQALERLAAEGLAS